MLEHVELRELLPHRHPVLLVDRAVEYEPGRRIVTLKAVSGSEPCYAGITGTAPDAYAFPETLLVESFGQSGALLWLRTMADQGRPLTGVLIFASARDCVFEGRAYPGDVLRHVVRLDQTVGDNAFLSGETWVGDHRIAVMGSAVAVIRQAEAVATSAGNPGHR
jgi:3-hydroxyacyl-[acyl-carrier-protein] dehydratase